MPRSPGIGFIERTRSAAEKTKGGFAHLGYLGPILLSPILFHGSQESKCLYSALVLLLLWVFNTAPKPIAAFLPVVNYPLFHIMDPQEVAMNYFSLEILGTASALLLATTVESVTSLVPRVSLGLCARFGLRRRSPFIVLCLFTFLAAMFLPGTTLAAPLLYLVDRVLVYMHRENLDTMSEPSARARSQDNVSVASSCPEADVLLDRLTEVMDQMSTKRDQSSVSYSTLKRTGEPKEDSERKESYIKDADGEKVQVVPTPSPADEYRDQEHRPSSVASSQQGSEDEEARLASHRTNLQRRPSILKDTRTPSRQSLSRRSSVVDFGWADVKTIEPNIKLNEAPGRPTLRPTGRLPASRLRGLRLSLQSGTSPYTDIVGDPHRSRSSFREAPVQGMDSVDRSYIARALSVGQIHAINEIGRLRETRERRQRDVRSAFLFAPAMVYMLGTLASLHTLPAKEAVTTLFRTERGSQQQLTLWSWTAVALPGSLVALLFCYLYFYRTNLRPYEPSPDDQVTATATAEAKLSAMGPLNLVDYICLTYVGIYPVCCSLAGIFGCETSQSQASILSLLVIISSLSVPWSKQQLLNRKMIASKLPWGVIFIMGCTTVSAQMVEDNDLVGTAMRYIRMNEDFWRRQSPIMNQTILTTVACILAEVTDNVALSQLLMPVVQGVAVETNRHVGYYAIPVAVGACTNAILPMSVPCVMLHDTTDVALVQLLVAGMAVKTLLIAMVLLSMNTTGRFVFDMADPWTAPRAIHALMRNSTAG